MYAALPISALVISVLYYAIRASEVRLEAPAVRIRKRWISGLGVLALAPVLVLLIRESFADRQMLGFLAGLLVVCSVMFCASFLVHPTPPQS